MKNYHQPVFLVALMLFAATLNAQNSVAIGTATPNSNAVLLLVGNNKQGLIIPSTTDHTQITASTPETGMVVYNSTQKKIYYFDGANWNAVGGGGSTYSLSYNSATRVITLNPAAGGATIDLSTTPVGGDLSGTLASATVAKLNGKTIPAFAAGVLTSDVNGVLSWSTPSGSVPLLSNGQILTGNGTLNSATTLGGDATLSGGNLTITKLGGQAYTFPSSSSTAGVLTNSAGTLTWAPVSITGVASGDLTGNYPNPTIANTAATGGNLITSINSAATTINGARVNPSFGALPLTAGAGTLASLVVSGTTKLGSNTYTWPSAALSAGTFLQTDASGNLTWATLSGGGNMSTSVYDINANGKVDDSEKIGGSTWPTTAAQTILQNNGSGVLSWINAVPVANGGTGLSTSPANGQLLIGNAGAYSLATLTSGTGINITNSAGSITIASTGLSNPMTLANQMIYGGAGGAPTALAVPAANQVLTSNNLNVPTWSSTVSITGLTVTGATTSLNNKTYTWPNNPTLTAGTYLQTDASGNLTWATASVVETDPTVKAINGIVKGTGASIMAATAGTDYLAPFGSQTAKFIYAAPNAAAGVPSFRALVASDIPTLNQSTTGSAGSVTNALTIGAELISAGPLTYNGSTARTIGIQPSSVTNAMLAGSIASSKLVGTDIATVGTITTGTWKGTAINEAYGGTNQTSYAAGDILYASTPSTLAKLAISTPGYVLTVNAGGTAPFWAPASGASGWSLAGNDISGSPTSFLGTTGSNDLVFKTNSTERSRIVNTTGYLGLGTTAPNARLGVSGAGIYDAGISLYNTGGGTEWRIGSDIDGGLKFIKIPGTTITPLSLTSTGAVGFSGSYGNAGQVLTSNGNAAAPTWTTISASSFTTANVIPKGSAGGLVSSLLNDSGTGVGIGTTSPATEFEIDATAPTIRMKSSTASTLSQSYVEFGHDDGSGGFTKVGHIGDTGSGDNLYLFSPNNILFNSNFADRFGIGTAGQLGVGSPLDFGTAGYVLTSGGASGTAKWSSLPTTYSTLNTIPKGDGTSALTSSMIYDNGTTVGIGTTTPLSTATVDIVANNPATDGTSGVFLDIQNSSNNTNNLTGIRFTGSSNNAFKKTAIFVPYTNGLYGVSDMVFALNGANNSNVVTTADAQMIIKAATGNVGIGTTTYSTLPKLHVYSDNYTSGLKEVLRLTGGSTVTGDGPLMNFQSAYGGATPTTYQEWISAAIGSPYSGSYQGDLTFYTNNGGLTSGSIASTTYERMRITSTGNIGIGTSGPDMKLTVNGSADKTGGGTWSSFSDRRVKKDIGQFTDGLSLLTKINPVKFKYNGLGGYSEDGKEYVGVIAQEVQAVAPYMITTVNKKLRDTDTSNTDLLMYDGTALTYILVNAVKEQQKIIDEQKKQIEELKNQQSKKELSGQSELNQLKAEIANIKKALGMDASNRK